MYGCFTYTVSQFAELVRHARAVASESTYILHYPTPNTSDATRQRARIAVNSPFSVLPLTLVKTSSLDCK